MPWNPTCILKCHTQSSNVHIMKQQQLHQRKELNTNLFKIKSSKNEFIDDDNHVDCHQRHCVQYYMDEGGGGVCGCVVV